MSEYVEALKKFYEAAMTEGDSLREKMKKTPEEWETALKKIKGELEFHLMIEEHKEWICAETLCDDIRFIPPKGFKS